MTKRDESPDLLRRRLIQSMFGAGVLGAAGTLHAAPLRFFKPLHIDNPLASYPRAIASKPA